MQESERLLQSPTTCRGKSLYIVICYSSSYRETKENFSFQTLLLSDMQHQMQACWWSVSRGLQIARTL